MIQLSSETDNKAVPQKGKITKKAQNCTKLITGRFARVLDF